MTGLAPNTNNKTAIIIIIIIIILTALLFTPGGGLGRSKIYNTFEIEKISSYTTVRFGQHILCYTMISWYFIIFNCSTWWVKGFKIFLLHRTYPFCTFYRTNILKLMSSYYYFRLLQNYNFPTNAHLYSYSGLRVQCTRTRTYSNLYCCVYSMVYSALLTICPYEPSSILLVW